MHAKAILRTFSWRQLFYHGEAVGLVAAWAVGLIVALSAQPAPEAIDKSSASDGLAVVSQSAPAAATPIK